MRSCEPSLQVVQWRPRVLPPGFGTQGHPPAKTWVRSVSGNHETQHSYILLQNSTLTSKAPRRGMQRMHVAGLPPLHFPQPRHHLDTCFFPSMPSYKIAKRCGTKWLRVIKRTCTHCATRHTVHFLQESYYASSTQRPICTCCSNTPCLPCVNTAALDSIEPSKNTTRPSASPNHTFRPWEKNVQIKISTTPRPEGLQKPCE